MTVKIITKDGTVQLLGAHWHPSLKQPSKLSKNFYKTKAGRVLACLMAGKTLTTYEAVLDFDVLFLPSVIASLQKRLHIKVERERVSKTNNLGETLRFKKYWITAETISQIKSKK
jgi:hypothetical protein